MNNMNITLAQYTQDTETNQNVSIKATIDGTEMFVPLDPANRHYQGIQEWVAEGNTIQEAD
tara:strand:- start:64 stop:246 length:183 start_codon:yes stop_codon:yes gene_type:complete